MIRSLTQPDEAASESAEPTTGRGDPGRRSLVIDVAILAGLLGVLLVVEVSISGWVPTGADPGNWLAVGRELYGADAMSVTVSYPPLVPALLGGLLPVVGPIASAVVVETLARAALVGAVYLCVRPLGRAYAVVGGLVVGLASAQIEALAWGAYPQILATGLALLALYSLVSHLVDRQTNQLVWAIALSALTGLTHLLVAGLLAAAVVVAWLYWSWATGNMGRIRTGDLRAVAYTVIAAAAYPVVHLVISPPQEPILNPLGIDQGEALISMSREALPLWAIVAGAGLLAALVRGWRSREMATVSTGFALLAVSAGFFVILVERRILLVTQVAVVLLAAAGFARVYRALPLGKRRLPGLLAKVKTQRILTATVAIGIVGGLLAGGLASIDSTTDFYRVVDVSELRGLDELGEEDPGLVLASRGNSGIQVGWWVEGYLGVPTYSGLDTRYAAFEVEREQAEFANAVFSGELTDVGSELAEEGIDHIVVDRRGPDAAWLESSYAGSLPVVYDSDTLVILRAVP